MKKIKFKLSDERRGDQIEVIFTAVLLEDRYRIEWSDGGIRHELYYGEKNVKEFINDGDWIVI